MPSTDIELLSYTSFRGIPLEATNLRRAFSESNVGVCGSSTSTNSAFSMLKLSKTRITVGDSITVYWDIHETCGSTDWIGLFDLDGPTSLSNYLDCKQRGVTGARRGAIKWVISRSITFSEVETKCIFKYISATTETVKAISPTLFVHNPLAEIPGSGRTRRQSNIAQETLLEFSVSELRALGLKKNIFGKPSPYVKLSIIPSRRHFRSWKHHHGQIAKTSSQSSTINPEWQSEEFVFLGGHDDMLEIEVRNKFSGTRPAFSRFLGKLCIPLGDIFDCRQAPRTDVVTKPLGKRTPADRIQGTITFAITVMTSANTTGRGVAGTEQENVSPDASTPQRGATSTCVLLTNPALRSSAPNILQPLDLNSSSMNESTDTPSSMSPFNALEGNSDDVVTRRRAFTHNTRPYSELYTSDYVPLDAEPSTPRSRQFRTDTMSSVQSEMPRVLNLEQVDEIVEDATEVRVSVDGPLSSEEERPENFDDEEQEEITNQEAAMAPPTEEIETVTFVSVTSTDNDDAEDVESTEVSAQEMQDAPPQIEVSSDEDTAADLEADTMASEDEPTELADSSFVIRASLGSIELTEDSPLRIIEESELAREEEVAFSPRNLDLDDDSDDDEQMDTADILDDSGDVLSDEPSSMDDTTSVTASLMSDNWSIGTRSMSIDTASITASPSSDSLPLHLPPQEQEPKAMSSTSSDEIRSSSDIQNEVIEAVSPLLANMQSSQVSRTDGNVVFTTDNTSDAFVESNDSHGPAIDAVDPHYVFPEASEVIIDVTADSSREQNEISTQQGGIPLECHPVERYPDTTSAGHPVERYPDATSTGHPVERYPDTTFTGHPVERYPDTTFTGHPVECYPDTTTTGHPVERYPDATSSGPAAEIRILPSTSSKRATTRQLSLLETVDRIVLDDSVTSGPGMRRRASEGIPARDTSTVEILSAEVIASESSRSPSLSESTTPSPRVHHEGSSPLAAVASLAFPMEIAEPVCLDQSPIEGPSFEIIIDEAAAPADMSTTNRLNDRASSARSNRADRILEERVRPSRPTRRSKQLARSTSDPRCSLSSGQPERPDRPRRRRTETDPRGSRLQAAHSIRSGVAAVVAVSEDVTPTRRTEEHGSMEEATERDSLSDSIVVALPMSPAPDSPSSGSSSIVVVSVVPDASSSVTPLPSPSLESDAEGRDFPSNDHETVVAVPVAVSSAESTSSVAVGSEERTVVAAALPMSPVHTTSSVTPLPSPTSPLATPRHGDILTSQRSTEHRERSSRPAAPVPAMDYHDESFGDEATEHGNIAASLNHPRNHPESSTSEVNATTVTGSSTSASEEPIVDSNRGAVPKPSSLDRPRGNVTQQLRDYVRNAVAPPPNDVMTYEDQVRAGQRAGELLRTERIDDHEEPMRAEPRGNLRPRVERRGEDLVTYEEQMRLRGDEVARTERRGNDLVTYEEEMRARSRGDEHPTGQRRGDEHPTGHRRGDEHPTGQRRGDETTRAVRGLERARAERDGEVSRTEGRGDETPGQTGRRGRPPRDEPASEGSLRRRSARQQRGDGQHPQNVHLQIQDQPQRQTRTNRDEEEPLPPNWERGVDSHGRVYYINHAHRTTTWNRPTRETRENESNMNDINTHWQSLDRRYQSFRRTLRGRNRHGRPPLHPNARPNQSEESTASASPPVPRTPTRPQSGVAASTPAPDSLPSTRTPAPAPVSTPGPSDASPRSRQASGGGTGSRNRSIASVSSARSAALLNSPALKFVTRVDFIDFIKNSGVAGQYYFQSQMLKLIISKIRSDPSQFERYRHQVELVRFLNQFADPQIELLPGWDKKVDQNGRLYFIDHNTRTTSFIDPRLPASVTTERRQRSATESELQPTRRSRAPPPRPPPPHQHTRSGSTGGTSTTLTYNQQVIGFLSQPNIDEIIARKQPQFVRSPALKSTVRRAQIEGERALERLSNNIDFVMLLSMFEDEIMSFVPPEMSQSSSSNPPTPSSSQPPSPARAPTTRTSALPDLKDKGAAAGQSTSASPAPYRRDFEAKVRSFHRQLYHKGYGQGPNKIKLSIRRDRLLEDAYDQIMKETARNLQRNRLEIQFSGEEGLDYGGPAREFFFLISRQIFNPYYGLFEYSANDTYTVQVSPVSLYVDNSHEWFRFCGRLLGLVIIHQHLLDAFFTRTFYKSLLRSSCDLSDVEALDALFHQSMVWVMENEIEDVLDLTFSVTEEIFGQVTERELIPGGKDIIVTEDNKGDYVSEMVKWRVERGVSEQMESIVRGFNEVIDPALVNIFDARELELVISGTADIDIKDWRRNTEYRSGYHDNHKVVKWFWKGVSSFDNEQRLRLLQFVTGTSSIPYEGFTALRGSTGPRKFSIERWGDYTKLPRAHTCFNRLDLPIYRSYDELLEKLTYAVEETGSFAMQ